MLSASAADKTVYNNGQLAEGINVYGWWNDAVDFNAANPTGGETKVFSFKTAALQARWACLPTARLSRPAI